MLGAERRSLADAYWQAADPALRAGPDAETFFEFDARVDAFATTTLPLLPDRCVLFGHGIWIALLFWRLMGFAIEGSTDMVAFRRFRQGLPMPNCAVYALESDGGRWQPKAQQEALRDLGG